MNDDDPTFGETEEHLGLLKEMWNDQQMLAAQDETQEKLSRESVWVTRDKRHVVVKDMDDRHLLNTVRVLRGGSPVGTTYRCDPVRRREWVNVMSNEAYRRGLRLLEKTDDDHGQQT